MREIKFRAWDKKRKEWMALVNTHIDMLGLIHWEFAGTIELIENQDDVVLMQYTGLKDCNGVEIYEGDIVDAVLGIHIIRNFIEDTYFLKTTMGDAAEVIGNIYENPELLNDSPKE